MVSGRNSSGNLALRFAGMIFCAALSATERIVEARSSDDNVSGFVSPSAVETSCWRLSLIRVWFKERMSIVCVLSVRGAIHGRKFSSQITGRWSVDSPKSDGTKHRAMNRMCVAGTNTWSRTARLWKRGWRHVQRFESRNRKCDNTCLRLFSDAICNNNEPFEFGVISFFSEYGPTMFRGCFKDVSRYCCRIS